MAALQDRQRERRLVISTALGVALPWPTFWQPARDCLTTPTMTPNFLSVDGLHPCHTILPSTWGDTKCWLQTMVCFQPIRPGHCFAPSDLLFWLRPNDEILSRTPLVKQEFVVFRDRERSLDLGPCPKHQRLKKNSAPLDFRIGLLKTVREIEFS